MKLPSGAESSHPRYSAPIDAPGDSTVRILRWASNSPANSIESGNRSGLRTKIPRAMTFPCSQVYGTNQAEVKIRNSSPHRKPLPGETQPAEYANPR